MTGRSRPPDVIAQAWAAVRDRIRAPPGTSVIAYAAIRAVRGLGTVGTREAETLPAGVTVRDRTISGSGSETTVPVRCYRPPDAAATAPVTVFVHGGGWVSGNLDTNRRLCALLARETGRVVVAVGYRLAPEHRYPAALNDCERVLRWIATRGPEHGLDPSAVRLFGTSAGGSLVAALHADPPTEPSLVVDQQTLVYPPLDPAFDARGRESAALRRVAGPLLRRLWDLYLPPDADRTDPTVAPLRAARFDAVPPTTVVTCGLDPLRPEGRAYVERLAAADVPVAHVDFPRLPHGAFTLLTRVSDARTVAALRRIREATPERSD